MFELWTISIVLQLNNESDSKYDNVHTTQIVESLTAKLNQAQEDAKEERSKLAQLANNLKEYESELDRIPLLIAQVCIEFVDIDELLTFKLCAGRIPLYIYISFY